MSLPGLLARIFPYAVVSGMPNKILDFLSKQAHDVSLFSTLEIHRQMSRDPEDDDRFWFRPVWETEEEAALEPPGPPAIEPDYDHPLLTPSPAPRTPWPGWKPAPKRPPKP